MMPQNLVSHTVMVVLDNDLLTHKSR